MNIYFGENKKKAEKITLKQLIFNCSKFFVDDGDSWINITQRDIERMKEVTVEMYFSHDNMEIDSISVFQSDLEIIDTNMNCILTTK